MIDLRLACNLTTSCQGAFLLCFPGFICNRGPTALGVGGRLAASDFTVPPHQTATVPVALTALGEHVASLASGLQSAVVVDLRNYGIVQAAAAHRGSAAFLSPSSAYILLTTADQGFQPPGGAVASCGLFVGATVLVGTRTSCGFADAVEKAYANSTSTNTDRPVTARSPVTGRTYTVQCVGASPHVCTDNTGSRVVWY